MSRQHGPLAVVGWPAMRQHIGEAEPGRQRVLVQLLQVGGARLRVAGAPPGGGAVHVGGLVPEASRDKRVQY